MPDVGRITCEESSFPRHSLLASVRERVWGSWTFVLMWLTPSHTETTDSPPWIFKTVLSLRPVFSSVPAGSGFVSMVQGCTSPNLGVHVFQQAWSQLPWEALNRSEVGWSRSISFSRFPDCSQNHTSEKCRHSPGDSCPSVWSTNPSHLLCSSLGKILKVLKCETKRVSTFVPARKHSRGVEFVFPIRLHTARPLPSPSQVGLINGLLSQHNEVQRGVRLLGHSPNSFCRRITFGSLCTIKQRTCGSLIYQVGSEDDYFSSSRYTQHALIAEAKRGIWGIQTLFTFRWNWISELYTKLGKGVSDQDGGEDRLLYRVTDRLI